MVATAPAWRLCWVFEAERVTRRSRVLGIGRAKVFAAGTSGKPASAQVELHRTYSDKRPRPWTPGLLNFGLEYALYALLLIRPDGTEWVRIDTLTEGEARWLAGVLFAEFPSWFHRP